MKKIRNTLCLILPLLLISHFCSAQSITRAQMISNAVPYTNFTWTASACNKWNGVSCGGRTVYSAPWVTVGSNTSMPYMWGGWSTTSQHINAMSNCKSAGDVCSSSGGNCSGGGSGLSQQCASGHDCSGLVSRAWALNSKYATITLPDISTSLALSQTQQGDILNIYGSHTRLIETNYGNGNYRVIESSGTDWKTAYHSYTANSLSSYDPRQYANMAPTAVACNNDDCNGAVTLISNGSCQTCSVDNATADGFGVPSCDNYTPQANILGAGVFFKFTAQSASHKIVVTPSGTLDAVIVVYSGGCFSLSEIQGGCMDQSGGNGAVTTLNLSNLTVGQQYTVRVYDYGAGNATSGGFSICLTHNACTPVTVASQPSDQTVNVNGTASFTVSVNGTPPFSYFWYKNGAFTNVSTTNTSSTSSTYTTPTLSASDNGNYYYCLVTNCSSQNQSQTNNAYVTVTSPCTYSINPSTQNFISSSGSGSFSVAAGSGCTWTASSNCSWVTTSSTGSGNGTVNFSVAANTGAQRTCTVTVGGQTFTVTQDAAACSYSLSQSSQNFASGGGSGTFSVSAGSNCAWTASANCGWVTTSSAGTGNGSVSFSVSANTGGQRTCTIAVGGQTFTVTQDGTTPCSFTISPSSGTYPSSAGSGNFSVAVSPASCAWTATANCGWITLTNPSGTGDGVVSFTMDANAGANSRSCGISVNGQTFTVTQSGTSAGTLTADFSAGQTSGSCPLSVNFIDQSVGSPQTYVWEFFGNGVNPNTSTSSSPTVTYSQCGVFTVKLTVVGNGSSDENVKTGFINVVCPCETGFEDDVEGNSVSIIPNPSNGKFEISIAGQGDYHVKIFNMLGQIVFENLLPPGNHGVDLVGKSKGIYLLQIEGNRQILSRKIYVD